MKNFSLFSAIILLGSLSVGAWYYYDKNWSQDAKQRDARLVQREILLNRVRNQLKDPASAQFKIYTQRDDYLCGEVNSKNSLGGYVGFQYFVVDGSYVNFKPDVGAKLVGITFFCPN